MGNLVCKGARSFAQIFSTLYLKGSSENGYKWNNIIKILTNLFSLKCISLLCIVACLGNYLQYRMNDCPEIVKL